MANDCIGICQQLYAAYRDHITGKTAFSDFKCSAANLAVQWKRLQDEGDPVIDLLKEIGKYKGVAYNVAELGVKARQILKEHGLEE